MSRVIEKICASCLTPVLDKRTIRDEFGDRDVCFDCLVDIRNEEKQQLNAALKENENWKNLSAKYIENNHKANEEWDALAETIQTLDGANQDTFDEIERLRLKKIKKKKEKN